MRTERDGNSAQSVVIIIWVSNGVDGRWVSMEYHFSSLLKKKEHVLFEEAQTIAQSKQTEFRWPIFFNTRCTTNPPCRHCLQYGSRYYDIDWGRQYSQDEVVKKANDLQEVGIKKRILYPGGWVLKYLIITTIIFRQ